MGNDIDRYDTPDDAGGGAVLWRHAAQGEHAVHARAMPADHGRHHPCMGRSRILARVRRRCLRVDRELQQCPVERTERIDPFHFRQFYSWSSVHDVPGRVRHHRCRPDRRRDRRENEAQGAHHLLHPMVPPCVRPGSTLDMGRRVAAVARGPGLRGRHSHPYYSRRICAGGRPCPRQEALKAERA